MARAAEKGLLRTGLKGAAVWPNGCRRPARAWPAAILAAGPTAGWGGADLRRHGHVAPRALELWERAIRQRRLSARSAERVLRVSRTIADLNDEQDVGAHAIAEALTYRSFDRG